jgi:hypothetical protein
MLDARCTMLFVWRCTLLSRCLSSTSAAETKSEALAVQQQMMRNSWHEEEVLPTYLKSVACGQCKYVIQLLQQGLHAVSARHTGSACVALLCAVRVLT